MRTQNIIIATRNTLLLCLIVLTGTIEAWGVEYQTKYKGTMYNVQSSTSIGSTIAPVTTFQSTSAYSEQWQEEEQVSMLNSDGSIANSPLAAAPSGPRRAPGNGTGAGTPGGTLDPTTQQPLGDVLLPLMLLACAYAIYKVSRRRKEA
ncbi:MAG: hypothetical protein IJV28_01375 [Paludibacteraceae bacterium]|nr:hypothetical protein [Paludibacteraceae bacterium]